MKTCPRCSKELEFFMFYKSASSSDQLSVYCKPCSSEYAKQWREKNLTPERLDKYKKAFKNKHPGYATQKKKEWANANPEKYAEQRRRKEKRAYEKNMKKKHGENYVVGSPENRTGNKKQTMPKEEYRKRYNARRATQKAILSGRLVKQPCFVCGASGDDVEAHHPSYALPLAVTWLCTQHHKQLHKEHKHKLLSHTS